jgi:hypothetical protein
VISKVRLQSSYIVWLDQSIEMNEDSSRKSSLKELLREARSYAVGDMRRARIDAEIKLLMDQRNQRYVLAGVIAAAISATGSMVAAIASLMALHAK